MKEGKQDVCAPSTPEGCTLRQHTKSETLHLTDYKTPHVCECGGGLGVFFIPAKASTLGGTLALVGNAPRTSRRSCMSIAVEIIFDLQLS